MFLFFNSCTPQQRQSVYKKPALVDYIQIIRGLICLTNHRCLSGARAVINYFRLCFTTPLRLVQEHKRLHKATFKPDHVDRLFFPAKNRCNVTDLVRDTSFLFGTMWWHSSFFQLHTIQFIWFTYLYIYKIHYYCEGSYRLIYKVQLKN